MPGGVHVQPQRAVGREVVRVGGGVQGGVRPRPGGELDARHRTPSDADFDAVKRHLSDAQIADLTFQVGAIRSWNMLNASFHTPVPETPYMAD